MTAQLADATSAKEKRSKAESISATALKLAAKGDHKHLEIIRRITEGDRLEVNGSIIVLSWPDDAERPSEATSRLDAIIGSNGSGNGNGSH
jgi:uncharacterized protein (UPF0333 family)